MSKRWLIPLILLGLTLPAAALANEPQRQLSGPSKPDACAAIGTAREGGGPVWPKPPAGSSSANQPSGSAAGAASSPPSTRRTPASSTQVELPQVRLETRSARPLRLEVRIGGLRTFAGRIVYLEARTVSGRWTRIAHAMVNRRSVAHFGLDRLAEATRLRALLPAKAHVNPARRSAERFAYPPSCLTAALVAGLRRQGLAMDREALDARRWDVPATLYRNEDGDIELYEFTTDANAKAVLGGVAVRGAVRWGPLVAVAASGHQETLEARVGMLSRTAAQFDSEFACFPKGQESRNLAVCAVQILDADDQPVAGEAVCLTDDFYGGQLRHYVGAIPGMDLVVADAGRARPQGGQRGVCAYTDGDGLAAVEVRNANPSAVSVSATLPGPQLVRSVLVPFPLERPAVPRADWEALPAAAAVPATVVKKARLVRQGRATATVLVRVTGPPGRVPLRITIAGTPAHRTVTARRLVATNRLVAVRGLGTPGGRHLTLRVSVLP
jgi:hypothetical protein